MNLLYIFQYPIKPSKGGVQRVTDVLASGFREKGHNVYYLCTESSSSADTNTLPYQFFLKSEDEQVYLDEYLELLKRLDINVVICQHALPKAIRLLKFTPKHIKRISVHHMNPFSYVKFPRYMKMRSYPIKIKGKIIKIISILFPEIYRSLHVKSERHYFIEMLNVSEKVVLLSEKFIRILKEFIPEIDLNKICAINNPNTFETNIDTQYKKKQLIIFVARLTDSQKNVSGFIDMWNKLSKNYPDWNAVIIGDGADRSRLERYSILKKVRRLIFRGRINNVRQYYQEAKFVCVTSIYEGWGMVLTEGMANGCVPVCFDSYESCRDIIEDGKSGIICKPFDITEMSQRISKLIENDIEWQKISEEAKKKVMEFEKDKIVSKWESLLIELHK